MRYVLSGKEVLTRATIKETLEVLPAKTFLQVHRSFIVNPGHVDKVEKHQLSICGYIVPVSTTYLKGVRQRFP